jgi:SAM-dependent methyltransferase
MIDYYARRASEYEKIYAKPERQDDLKLLREKCRDLFAGRDLLEISCGTAWWTECCAETARHITATDINPEVLEIAAAKAWKHIVPDFKIADSMDLPDFGRSFDAGFAGFWWSHVPLRRLPDFLTEFHARLLPGSRVAFIDNRYVEGSSTPISRHDANGDTWQMRQLADGSHHEILKNFPTEAELRGLLAPLANDLEIHSSDYFWIAVYRTPFA